MMPQSAHCDELLRSMAIAAEAGRSIAYQQFVDELAREGYKIHTAAEAAIELLHGLVLKPKLQPDSVFTSGDATFEPVIGESDRLEYWSQELDDPLVPVGWWSETMIVAVGESGRYYAGMLGLMIDLGVGACEALEVLVLSLRHGSEIELPE